MIDFLKKIFSADKISPVLQNQSETSLIVNPINEIDTELLIGYNSVQEQQIIYSVLMNMDISYTTDSILDVGCGAGDLYQFIKDKTIKYTGIDYNPNLINLAKLKFPDTEFKALDLFNLPKEEKYDWVIGASLFIIPMHDDMVTYTKMCIDRMYSTCNKGMSFNARSTMFEMDRPEHIQWYNPMYIFEYCARKYKKVILRHDYMSEDFTVYIYK